MVLEFSLNLQVLHGGLDPRSSGVSVRRPNHYTTGEGVFNTQNQGYFKIPRFWGLNFFYLLANVGRLRKTNIHQPVYK